MTFFNKKEDVMAIELTPHGRRLLSEGKLKPMYYAFLDDDILYDSQRASFEESNSESKVRILTDTPKSRPQTNYHGIESSYYNTISGETQDELIHRIGTNTLTSKNASSWKTTMVLGEITSSLPYISSPTSPIIHVPQVECDVNYTVSANFVDADLPPGFGPIESYIENSLLALDGSRISLEKSDFIVHLLEKNGFDYKDSLNLEVFIYEQNKNSFRNLEFVARRKQVKEDILLEPETQFENLAQIDENTVEYYFDLSVDKEISERDICRGATRLKNENIYLGLDINCEDFTDLEVDIYQTDQDYEECPE
jgi:hypothetical protein